MLFKERSRGIWGILLGSGCILHVAKRGPRIPIHLSGVGVISGEDSLVVLLRQKVVSRLLNHHVLILVINRSWVILIPTLRLFHELSLKCATSHALLGLLFSSKSLRVIQ